MHQGAPLDRETSMKTFYSHKRTMGMALALLASGLASTVEAQPTGAGGLVAHYVARLYIDPATGQGQCVGYFTDIAGITASLFNGTPGEDTAYFTFRSDVFQLSPLPADGDLQPDLFSAGNYAIYFNRHPIGDWTNPGTFSSGQPIAAFTRPESFVSLLPQSFHSVIREQLVSTEPFRFDGHNYDLRAIAPGGLTLMDVGSTTALSGISGFSLVLPYAGSAIAVGADY
jgi:hypothetical protein